MKRTSTVILIATFSLFLILLSCTLPIYIVTNPTATSKDDATEAPTSTPAITETPTTASTATYQYTPTVSVNLDGAWTIWQGSSQQQLDIDFLQKDYSITANVATGDGNSLLIEGTISHDGTSASGDWESTNGTSGSFVMYLDGSYTMFSGNMGGGVPFCGNRLSSNMPSPCLK